MTPWKFGDFHRTWKVPSFWGANLLLILEVQQVSPPRGFLPQIYAPQKCLGTDELGWGGEPWATFEAQLASAKMKMNLLNDRRRQIEQENREVPAVAKAKVKSEAKAKALAQKKEGRFPSWHMPIPMEQFITSPSPRRKLSVASAQRSSRRAMRGQHVERRMAWRRQTSSSSREWSNQPLCTRWAPDPVLNGVVTLIHGLLNG